jgi:lysophospholipase L1-like esterase
MKKLLFLLAILLAAINSFSQSVYKIEGDTVRAQKRLGANTVLDIIGRAQSTGTIKPGTDTTTYKQGLAIVGGKLWLGNGTHFTNIQIDAATLNGKTDTAKTRADSIALANTIQDVANTAYDAFNTLSTIKLNVADSGTKYLTPKRVNDSLTERAYKDGSNATGKWRNAANRADTLTGGWYDDGGYLVNQYNRGIFTPNWNVDEYGNGTFRFNTMKSFYIDGQYGLGYGRFRFQSGTPMSTSGSSNLYAGADGRFKYLNGSGTTVYDLITNGDTSAMLAPKADTNYVTIDKAATNNNYTVKPINYGNIKPKIKKIVFIGDSNGKGYGLTDTSGRYPTQLANLLKCAEANNCVTGMTMQRASPVAYGGSLMTQLSLIPTYDTSYSYLSVTLGTNDVNINNGNYTAAGYRLALDTLLRNAITTKGWPASTIILNAAPYVTNLNYAGFSWTYARLNQYRDSLKSAAIAYGTLFFDETTVTTNNFIDSTYFQTDGLHLSVKGHQFIAMAQASILNSGTVYGDKVIIGQLAVGQIKDAPQWYSAIRTTSNVINGFQEIGYIKYLKNVSDFIEITINATDTLFRLPIYLGDTYSPSGRRFIIPINSWMPNNTWINVRPDYVTGLASGWELSSFEAMQLQMKLVTPSYKDSRYYFRIVSLRNGQSQTVNISIRTNDRAYSSNFIETYATGTDATAYNYFGGRTHFSSANGVITETVQNYVSETFNALAGYASNFASGYTTRSFTDKNYVDSVLGTKQAPITAGRGITLTGSTLGIDTAKGYTWTAAQTFSASLLNLGSSTQIKFGNNSFISSDGNGIFRFGFSSTGTNGLIAIDGLTSVSGISGGFNSGTNAAGSNLTFSPRDGTGTGTPGNIDLQTSNIGTSGSAAQAYTTKLRLWGNGNLTLQSGGTFTNNGYRLEIPTGNVKFGGLLEIGNTVNTVSPTSPNRTVTIVIGGVTYYLPAKTTND